jgi:hypothetical protein
VMSESEERGNKSVVVVANRPSFNTLSSSCGFQKNLVFARTRSQVRVIGSKRLTMRSMILLLAMNNIATENQEMEHDTHSKASLSVYFSKHEHQHE